MSPAVDQGPAEPDAIYETPACSGPAAVRSPPRRRESGNRAQRSKLKSQHRIV